MQEYFKSNRVMGDIARTRSVRCRPVDLKELPWSRDAAFTLPELQALTVRCCVLSAITSRYRSRSVPGKARETVQDLSAGFSNPSRCWLARGHRRPLGLRRVFGGRQRRLKSRRKENRGPHSKAPPRVTHASCQSGTAVRWLMSPVLVAHGFRRRPPGIGYYIISSGSRSPAVSPLKRAG